MGMKEGQNAVYEIKDSTPEAVEAMFCFLYTGDLPAVEFLPQVFELALQYELDGLGRATAEKMVEELSVSNVKAVITVLKLHSAKGAYTEEAYKAVLRKIKGAPTYDLLDASY